MSYLARLFTVILVGFSIMAQAAPADDIGQLLDHLHAAASAARFDDYFSLFTPDGVFIGTAPEERWTVPQFQAYAKPHFDKGQGWTYHPHDRHIVIAPDGRHASFDELLDNDKLVLCRGTGSVRRVGKVWKIEQYALTIPVPNERSVAVVQAIHQP